MNSRQRKIPTVVAAMGRIDFTGNTIPLAWLQCDKLRNGKLANLTAILVLSDIIYRYRPITTTDERSQDKTITHWQFAGDKAYFEYDRWIVRLGITKRQLQDAIAFLVKQGLITHEFHPVYREADGSRVFNRVFVEPVPAAIAAISDVSKLCEYDDSPPTEKRDTYPDDDDNGGGSRDAADPIAEKRERVSGKTREGDTKKRETPPVKPSAIRAKTTSETTAYITQRQHTDHTPPVVSGVGAVAGRGDVVCLLGVNKNTDALDADASKKYTILPSGFSVIENATNKSNVASIHKVVENDLQAKNESGIKIPTQVVSSTQSIDATPAIKSDNLIARLVGIGVRRDKARELVANFAPDAIEHQIACLPYRHADDPAAVLIRSIEGKWGAPPAYKTVQKEMAKAQEKEQDDARAAAEYEAIQQRKADLAAAQKADDAAKSARKAEVDAVLSRLSQGQQEALEAAVWEELAKEAYPVGPAARAVIDKVKSADDAKKGNVVGRAYIRVEAHLAAEWAVKGGAK